MNRNKIVSIFLVGILMISAVGVVQADGAKDEKKDKENEKGDNLQRVGITVEEMTIHNWSFIVGPDDEPDRTVYIDPISIEGEEYELNAKKLPEADSPSDVASLPAKKKAMAQAKQDVQREEGETVRICIREIEIKNVRVDVLLPERMPSELASSSSSSEWQSLMSEDSQLPSFHVTVERLTVDKWSFLVGPNNKQKPDETITIGDVTLQDETIRVGPSTIEDWIEQNQVREELQRVRQGIENGKTYQIIVQNIEIRNVKLIPEWAEDEPGDSPGTTTTTTTTTTTEEDMTTTTSESGGDGTEETTDSGGQPGFGIGIAVVALVGAALLALRRD